MIEGSATPQRPQHQLGEKRPVAGVGKIVLAERPVQEDVGIRSAPVDAG